MDKPQVQFEHYRREQYPEIIDQYYRWLTKEMPEIHQEYLDQLVEDVYKIAYLDGLLDALYFSDVY